MRRLMIHCSCGERIQVPQSALGKAGICPSCGTTIQITKENATPYRPGSGPSTAPPRQTSQPGERTWTGGGANAPDDVRRRFAEAVDLYFAKRYSEALVMFNALSALMPHDADIQMGQSMCLNALRKISPLGLGHEMRAQLPAPVESNPDRVEAILNGPTPDLDPNFFRRFLADKMLHGANDEIQLRAAELAAKILGYLDTPQRPPAPEPEVVDNGYRGEEDDIPRPTPFRRAAAPDDIDR
ncbi:MAG TPA: hypothetical protein PLJ47_09735 [Candidatus Hydrogenedentes bacterium]|nr:hypothetical protein [Candidatus Hydrogenedentota bacterium]